MTDQPERLTIALAGNPNVGKTTIFNAITGAHQHVGNWPGVTVEKKEGRTQFDGVEITVVDLPGIYSLTAYSVEEIIARKFVVHEKPDVVVHVIDASNLERNLCLTTQLLELDCRLVLALNMSDQVKSSGARIDVQKMGDLLGAPAVATIGSRDTGIQTLMETIVRVARADHPQLRPIDVFYGREMESHIREITDKVAERALLDPPHPPRWIAIKLLENDRELVGVLRKKDDATRALLEEVEKTRDHLFSLFKDDTEAIITERRYGFVAGILKEVYKEPPLDPVTQSDRIDSVLTHKLLGLPVFFFMIWAMFQLTFSVGAYPMAWIETVVEWLSQGLAAQMAEGMLKSLVIDGMIGGVGSVLVFLPNILILFLCISFFEDSGYMARAAFLTDRVMHLLGLHGKAFIPMLMGFGCNVPAIMATRTLESQRDRILTIMVNPLISCSARLPVYILIAGAFFPPHRAGTVIFSIYLLGLGLAIVLGRLFSKTILPGESAPFVMELPPYRMPTARSLMIHMWDRGKIFVRKMSGVILVGSIVIWTLGAFPRHVDFSRDYDGQMARLQVQREAPGANQPEIDAALSDLRNARETERIEASYIGRIGHGLEPVVAPLGFQWREAVALVTGFVAKEIVVSTLGVLHQAGTEQEAESEGLRKALGQSGMTPLIAYAFMAFVLIYTPCLGTVAAIRRETNSMKWTLFSIGYSLTTAWVVALAIVQVGRLFGLT